jgi:hypothetical protein
MAVLGNAHRSFGAVRLVSAVCASFVIPKCPDAYLVYGEVAMCWPGEPHLPACRCVGAGQQTTRACCFR